ncbi:putative peptidase [Xanthomarina gelatinilytica]|uniref:Putative peptidase n=1 Tax=Xanthomarina gelatinilytica TaxID=1137281 RepID=M7N7S9_9FLAO|nr:tRNA (5-methylaminomethyl-2-thiouridine)(34)-methyltransferase MnmD [Xanthomarina gelatinilytica]EMQ94533.1 putative peptidase [Xanthomarina gelatinilytica]
MERKIIITGDGSKTIQLVGLNEHYHSVHGALQEAEHVFIKHGLLHAIDHFSTKNQPISILEIGFGSGLNALATLVASEKHSVSIAYVGVEAYPVSKEEVLELDYATLFQEARYQDLNNQIHLVPWGTFQKISPHFSLLKQQKMFKDITDTNTHHLIYFDAFGPRVQPDLWTESVFKIMFDALMPSGVLVTYSAKGSVRRAMQAVGFTVEKLPGPPGKREMLRATKQTATPRL